MLALRRAVPMRRTPSTADSASVPYASSACSCSAICGEADRLDVVDGHAERDRPGNVRRPRLELVRQHVPGGLLEGHGADHVAAAEKRRHRVEKRFLAVEDAHPRRAVELVPGRRVEVAVERLDVDRHVIRRLRPVEEHRHAALVRDADDLLHRVDGAQGVRHVRDGHELGPLADQRLELVEHQLAAIVDRRDAQPRPALLAQQLPRHDVRVVLHRRDEHFVSGADVRPPEGMRDEVDALGRVAGEDDLAFVRRVEETRRSCAGRSRTPRSRSR